MKYIHFMYWGLTLNIAPIIRRTLRPYILSSLVHRTPFVGPIITFIIIIIITSIKYQTGEISRKTSGVHLQ
jgi:hypothetical protein